LKITVGSLERRGCVELAMNANFVALFVWLPKQVIWLIVEILIMEWCAELFPDERHERAVIKFENYLALGARVFHTAVKWDCN
jgi:hypothetical protein